MIEKNMALCFDARLSLGFPFFSRKPGTLVLGVRPAEGLPHSDIGWRKACR